MTRAQYLFAFANMCHCPPPVLDELRISDFTQLLAGIKQAEAEARKAEARA